MGLIKCPECGKEISDKSENCVNCGFPIIQKENLEKKIKKDKKQSIYGIIGFVVALVGMCFGLYEGIFLWIISLTFSIAGCMEKNKKHGFAIAGNVISFFFLFSFLVLMITTFG